MLNIRRTLRLCEKSLVLKYKQIHCTKMPGRPKRKAVDDTAKKAKKAKGETDLKWDLKWSTAGKPDKNGINPVIVLSSDTLDGCTKIAGFDIDWTVIQTASGRKFATGNEKESFEGSKCLQI